MKSSTVVMEAAFFLLQEGLLDIPGVGGINVKQARAFLWNAAWLQEHMLKVWHLDGIQFGREPCLQDFVWPPLVQEAQARQLS